MNAFSIIIYTNYSEVHCNVIRTKNNIVCFTLQRDRQEPNEICKTETGVILRLIKNDQTRSTAEEDEAFV